MPTLLNYKEQVWSLVGPTRDLAAVSSALAELAGMFQEASVNVRLTRVAEAIFPKHSFPQSLFFVRIGDAIDPLADASGAVRWATWSPTAS